MSSEISEEDELLAAELAFGLIDGAERADAQERLGSDTMFAQAYARWQAHATALFTDRGEAPHASVWAAIEARLPANDAAPRMYHRSLPLWRMGTLMATAVAALLGLVALQKQETVFVRVPVAQAAVAPMVAVLTGKKGFVTITYDPISGHITSAASDLEIGDHSPQLWVIPADGKPRSMGVISASAPSWMKVPAAAKAVLTAGVTVAVSIEPAGGSPTGQPTGPVILTGKVATT